MADVRSKLLDAITQYRSRAGEPVPETPAAGNFTFVPQQSLAEKARLGFEAAAMQAADYPGLAEGVTGLLGALSPAAAQREARARMEQGQLATPGGVAMRGMSEGMQQFREATPGLDPWRGEVGDRTEKALQAGVPLLGILAAGAALTGIGPEDAIAAGLRTPAAALRAAKSADAAGPAARAAAKQFIPPPWLTPGGVGNAARREANRAATRAARVASETASGIPESGLAQVKRGVPRVRLLPDAEADRIAHAGEHLLPAPDGSFVGGPESVKGPNGLNSMRERVDRYVDMGAQWIDPQTREAVRGYDWYTRGRNAVETMAPGDPQMQTDLATALGIYSEARGPESNLKLGLREWNRSVLVPEPKPWSPPGTGLPNAGTEGQSQRFSKYMAGAPRTDPLGHKTLPYAQQLDPSQGKVVAGANDQIMGRVYGYGEMDFTRGMSDSEHAFMDAEQLLARDRANLRSAGNHDAWTTGEVQAAAWVGRRAEDLLAQGKVKTLEEGLQQSADDFSAFFNTERVLLPRESTPGWPGQAPGYKNQPFVQRQRQMSSAMRAPIVRGWSDPSTGADFMAQSLGIPSAGPTIKGLAGFWEGEAGLEVNPMEAAQVLADYIPGPHGRQLGPEIKEALGEMAMLSAYVDAQSAGSAVSFMPMIKSTSKGEALAAQNALDIVTGGKLTEPQMQVVARLAKKNGWAATAHDRGVILFPVEDAAPDGAALQKLLPQLRSELETVAPIERIVQGRAESLYEPLNAAVPGSGTATAQLAQKFKGKDAQFRMARLDSPQLRSYAASKLRWQKQLMDQGHPVRADYVNALSVLSEGGLGALLRTGAKGLLPLPVIMLVLADQDVQGILSAKLSKEEG